jgi:hypothetical protein
MEISNTTTKKRKDDDHTMMDNTSTHGPVVTIEEREEQGRHHSPRLELLHVQSKAQLKPINNIVLYLEKIWDGLEKARKKNSLKEKTQYNGGSMYTHGANNDGECNKVNTRRRKVQHGYDPCYDVIDEQGSSIYAYFLPLSIMAGLLLGFKSEYAVEKFKLQTQTLNFHQATNYMFLHWNGKKEGSKGDYMQHMFVKSCPGLGIVIESLGNYLARRILLNPRLAEVKQPGLLCNMKITDESFQEHHWDFIGWRKTKAKDMPWVACVSLCTEGMMLHVWPTQRDVSTHTKNHEHFKLGGPKLFHVGFGDALLLRADVCHGGCFGSKGNMRFHMVL